MRFERCRSGIVVLGLIHASCANSKAPEKSLYFDELRPPVGQSVKVIDDTNLPTAIGGSISVTAVVEPDIDREELDRLMESFYRQASTRKQGFRAGAVVQIEMRFYDNQKMARLRSEQWLGRVDLTPPDTEPTFSNRQRLPLLRWVTEALGSRPQYSGEVRPQIAVDPETLAAEITLPFVKDDGSGKYEDAVTFARATTDLASTAIALFDKIQRLQKLTLVGELNGETLCRWVLTRADYERINLRRLEENLGAYQGKLINLKLSGKVNDRNMGTLAAKRRQEIYRDAFAQLPKQSVTWSPKLR